MRTIASRRVVQERATVLRGRVGAPQNEVFESQNEVFEMRNDGAEKVAQKRSQAPEIVRSRKLARAYPEARASRSADSQSETDPRR